MIFNKSIIAGAIEIARAEKDDPDLSCVYFDKDGTVVAASRWAIYAASPTLAATAAKLPFPSVAQPFSGAAFPIVQMVDVLKAIPVDKQFKGMLEHVNIYKSDINQHEAQIHDGRGLKSIILRSARVHDALEGWRSRFASLGDNAEGLRFVYNRKRLAYAVEAVESACKYDGEFSYIEQKPFKNGLLWRAYNELTSQAVMVAWITPAVDKSPDMNAWEKGVMLGAAPVPAPVPSVPYMKAINAAERRAVSVSRVSTVLRRR